MKTVLIVDDSSAIRMLVKIHLKNNGYNIVEAANGSEAFKTMDGTRVDLVISDVNMPVMDGMEFLKRLRESSSHKFVPVIMLTTESEEEKRRIGTELGARAWITKPFDPARMLESIRMIIR